MLHKIKFPHTFVILFLLIVLVSLMTWFVPAGQFEEELNSETGVTEFDAESYHRVKSNPTGIFDLVFGIQKGFVDAANIIFLIFFAYFAVYTVEETGAFHGMINSLMNKLKGKEKLIIPIFMIIS